MPWQAPSLVVKWGPYTKPSPEEQLQTVQAVEQALGSPTKLITRKVGIEKLRDGGVIDVEDVQDMEAELDKEQAAADAKARENAKNQLADAAAVQSQTEARGAAARGQQPGDAPPPKGGDRGRPPIG